MIDLNNIKPGVNFLVMRHDNHCPAIESNRTEDCACSPDLDLVGEPEFKSAVAQNRKQRRAAERATKHAIKKAGRK
jgi:hypothetical protein